MRIGVDIRGLLTGKRSGVEQYTLKLLEYLLRLDRDNTYVLFYVSYRDLDQRMAELLGEMPWLKQANVEIRTLRWINFPLLLHALWKPLDWPKVDKVCGGLDVLWLPSPRLTPASSACRVVITFHDLVYDLFPQFYTWQSNLWHWQMSYPYLARWADTIIAVSGSTKDDLIRLYGIPGGGIKVVYEGVDEAYFEKPSAEVLKAVGDKFKTGSRFIYYIGSLEPRKNIGAAIRAVQYLKNNLERSQFGKIKLVISGAKTWLADYIFDEVKKMKLSRSVIFTGSVTEEEKIALLHQAQVFVFPSFYEGFGLPVLEAMAAGCPVVTSRVASLPEVVDGAAVLVDPSSQAELNRALEKVLTNNRFARSLVTKGRLQARKFSWAKAAKETLKIFMNGGR